MKFSSVETILTTNFLVLATLFAASCKGQVKTTLDAKSNAIIGNNDLIPVVNGGSNIDQNLAPGVDAVALLEVDGFACTASHLGGGVVVSAGHCFPGLGTGGGY